MVVVPCSIKTAAAIAHCLADTLIARAADVTLKEGRPLILVVRESPLHLGHLRVLTALAEMGAVILPPMPAFYNRPKQIDDLVTHTLARVLDRLGLPHTLVPEWQGTAPPRRDALSASQEGPRDRRARAVHRRARLQRGGEPARPVARRSARRSIPPVLSYEVIFVDDGSQDRSAEIIRELPRRGSRVRLIKLKVNAGETAATDAGFKAVRGRYVVVMDADLQNDPHDIPGDAGAPGPAGTR